MTVELVVVILIYCALIGAVPRPEPHGADRRDECDHMRGLEGSCARCEGT